MNIFSKAFDWIMDWIYEIVAVILAILPNSPFQTEEFSAGLDKFSTIMAQINYFIPFGWMLTILTGYVTAVLIWYGLRWLLRIAQYID